MNRTVLKPFTTRQRRFAFGATVRPGDDLSPHTHEGLFERGFLTAAGEALEAEDVKAVEEFVAAAVPARRKPRARK